MIAKMIQDLRKRMEKMQEMFTEDIEELKNIKPDEQYTRRINRITEQKNG